MRNFNLAEVGELYQQHTAATGQIFTPEAIETAYDLTQGQPWLVNALAKEIVEKMVKDRSITITKEHILTAKEILIARQDTHLDSLAERLREKRFKYLSKINYTYLTPLLPLAPCLLPIFTRKLILHDYLKTLLNRF
jgi:hypothetical protein